MLSWGLLFILVFAGCLPFIFYLGKGTRLQVVGKAMCGLDSKEWSSLNFLFGVWLRSGRKCWRREGSKEPEASGNLVVGGSHSGWGPSVGFAVLVLRMDPKKSSPEGTVDTTTLR